MAALETLAVLSFITRMDSKHVRCDGRLDYVSLIVRFFLMGSVSGGSGSGCGAKDTYGLAWEVSKYREWYELAMVTSEGYKEQFLIPTVSTGRGMSQQW